MTIQLCSATDAVAVAAFYQRNAVHLAPWEPRRPADFHHVESWQQRLLHREQEQLAGNAAYFLQYDEELGNVIAMCTINGVIRGPFQAGYLGYCVDQQYQGQGIMKALCQHTIDFGFNQLSLHRLMANYMPHNLRSAYLLKQLGFVEEGLAKNYLFINGKWQDHVLTAKLNPNPIEPVIC
jgi:ribosomal-protein-alanine N-acetyltransferase